MSTISKILPVLAVLSACAATSPTQIGSAVPEETPAKPSVLEAIPVDASVPEEIHERAKLPRGSARLFMEPLIVVRGQGVAPTDRPLTSAQKYLLAMRAAKIVALREMAEVLENVRVTGDTLVVDIAARNDAIRATVDGLVKGSEVVYEGYNESTEMGVVYLRLRNMGPTGAIARLTTVTIASEAQRQPAPARPTASAAAMPEPSSKPQAAPPVAKQHDALIVDASGTTFLPAIKNRVLAHDGRLLFGADVIAPEILARKPLADYTNDLGKAKAILRQYGVENPLVVRVSRLPTATDAQVTEEDTLTINAANQHAQFLEGAKVVFLMSTP